MKALSTRVYLVEGILGEGIKALEIADEAFGSGVCGL